MKFAVVEGERREAQTGLSAECPICGAGMIAKCGRYRIWHWAHRGIRTCDSWWESETEWHRAWKNHFPKGWQEVIHPSKTGEKHIADVKTEAEVVLEFQHSFLSRDERESRERFYQKMVWIVNGRRRKRDKTQFFASLRAPLEVYPKLPIYSVSLGASALLRDWGATRVPVYFDFGTDEKGDTSSFDTTALWRLNSRSRDGRAYLSPVTRTEFLRVHLEGQPFEEMCTEAIGRAVADYLMRQALRLRPFTGFDQYLDRRQRVRRHF
jgi:competence protein CoiA